VAPSRRASASFEAEVLSIVTSAPIAAAELDAHVAEAAEPDDADAVALLDVALAAAASRS
jgi:hypothetical protein